MKFKLFVLTILSTIGFYNYHGILSDQVTKALFYLMILLSAFWAIKDGISIKSTKFPRVPYFIMLICILFSCVMASSFHSQSLKVSIMTTLPFIFAYGYFIILIKSDIPSEKILKCFAVLCGISIIVYFCNVLTMPNNMFGAPIINEDITRGIIRIPVVFINMFALFAFYGINKWVDTKKKIWLLVIAIAVFMIFMSVIRQRIALTLVLGLWFLFRQISAWKKAMLIFSALFVVVFILPQIPVYKAMIELSEDQRDNNDDEEDVRIQAWRYYTYENQTNSITPIFGNGIPSAGNSLWGRMFDAETEVNGRFAADVGWAGFYWYFGAIATICLMWLFLKAFLLKKPQDRKYLDYWLVFVVVTSVASGPIVYYWQIVEIAVVFALIYKPLKPAIVQKTEDEQDSTDNTQLQQFPRYPQLH